MMKRFLPGRVELSVFVAMALVAGLLVAVSSQRDAMLFFVTMPVFLVASLLGWRRNVALRAVPVKSEAALRRDEV